MGGFKGTFMRRRLQLPPNKNCGDKGGFYELSPFLTKESLLIKLSQPQKVGPCDIKEMNDCNCTLPVVAMKMQTKKWRSSPRWPFKASVTMVRSQSTHSIHAHKPTWQTLSLLNRKSVMSSIILTPIKLLFLMGFS